MYYLGDLCCVCLRAEGRLQRLSTADSSGLSYHTKMTSPPLLLDSDEVDEGTLICEQCCQDIDFVCEFREKCVRSAARLKEYSSQLYADTRQRVSVVVLLTDIMKCPVKREQIQAECNIGGNEEDFKTCFNDRSDIIKIENEDQVCTANSPIFCEVKMESADFKYKTEYNDEDTSDVFNEDCLSINLNDVKSEKGNEDGEELQYGAGDGSSDNLSNFSDIDNKVKVDARSGAAPYTELRDVDLTCQSKPNLGVSASTAHAIYVEHFTSIKDYKIITSPKGGQQQLECENCNSKFTSLTFVRAHSNQCVARNSFKRETYSDDFSSDSVKKHLVIHPEINRFECKICHKTFSQSNNLKRHSLIHSGEKPFECKICHKKFSQNDHLKRHSSIHTGEKLFDCKICYKKFPHQSNLRQHSLIHTGERPFQCKICDKKFIDNSSLRRHSLIHTGEKPFQCKICSKQFAQNSTLKTHSLVHAKQKPFECEICNKQFSQNSSLKIHALAHTAQQKLF